MSYDDLLDYGDYVKYHEKILELVRKNIGLLRLRNCFGGSHYTDDNGKAVQTCNCSGEDYTLHNAKMIVNQDFIKKLCQAIKEIVGCEKVNHEPIYSIDKFVDEKDKLIIVINNHDGEIIKTNGEPLA